MHREIREELSGHFQDLMLERQQLGATEEEAQQYAIAQMGDPQGSAGICTKSINRGFRGDCSQQ